MLSLEAIFKEIANQLDEDSSHAIKSLIDRDYIDVYRETNSAGSEDHKDLVLIEGYIKTSWRIYVPITGGFWIKIVEAISIQPKQEYPVTLEAFYSHSESKGIRSGELKDQTEVESWLNELFDRNDIQDMIHAMIAQFNRF